MSNTPQAHILRLPTALPVGHLVFFAGCDRTVIKVRYVRLHGHYLHVLS